MHRALTEDLDGVHLSLALTGGSAEPLGIEALLAGRYASYAVDLIDGPDSWRVVAGLPGDRGVIAGALTAHDDRRRGPELLLYAIGYAASTGARGRRGSGCRRPARWPGCRGIGPSPSSRAWARSRGWPPSPSTSGGPPSTRGPSISGARRSAATTRRRRRPSSRTSTKSRKSSSPGD